LIATVLLVIPINALLFGKVLREHVAPAGEHLALPIDGSRRKLIRYLAHDWVAGLLGQGTADLMPLIVLGTLGRTATAYFYIAFVIATAVATFAQSFTTALLVEAAHDEAVINQLARRTIVRCAVLIAPGVLAAIILTPLGLSLFGGDYASHADGVLRLLLLATLPQTAVAIASSIERIRGRAHRIVRYQAVVAVAGLALATPLIRAAGLAGIGWSWLIAQLLAACIAMPTIRSVLTGTPVRSEAVA
jgi:O-antigen/teichoic acid export membrane protein